jgi:1,4-dihydroxy-2-naphthoyl-CoA hydrolase
MQQVPSVEEINAHSLNSAAHHCGILVTEIDGGGVVATMPFDARTQGSDGALRLGALAILAESVGSLAATISVDREKYVTLGQTLQLHHLNSAASGPIRAKATSSLNNDSNQVWQIEMMDGFGTVIASATLSVVILPKSVISH